jgi:5-formyltetrahydrofolate cyclo-ligase
MRICVSRLEPVGSRAKPTAATWGTMSKTILRQRLLDARNAIPKATHQKASQAICAHLVRLFATVSGPIGSYLATGSEVDLDPFHQRLWQTGRELYVPKIRSKTQMDFVALAGPDDERIGIYGIRTSQQDNPVAAIALGAVLIPCTGFNSEGHRLGMGGGYYDRWLEHTTPGAPLRIGIAFLLQQIDFKAEIWDQKFDIVVTEAGVSSL